jgi:hypothetical protein
MNMHIACVKERVLDHIPDECDTPALCVLESIGLPGTIFRYLRETDGSGSLLRSVKTYDTASIVLSQSTTLAMPSDKLTLVLLEEFFVSRKTTFLFEHITCKVSSGEERTCGNTGARSNPACCKVRAPLVQFGVFRRRYV